MTWSQRIRAHTFVEAIRRIRRSMPRCASGSFAVEAGLIAPVVILLMLGAYETSSLIRSQMTLQGAARIGTQHALLRPPSPGNTAPIVTAVRQTLPASWLDGSNGPAATIAAVLECDCGAGGVISCNANCPNGGVRRAYLNVSVAKTHVLLFELPMHGGGSVALSSQSFVRLQ